MRPDSELCMTPRECMTPEEEERYLSKPDSYWLQAIKDTDIEEVKADRAALIAYVRSLEEWVVGCTSDPDAVTRERHQHGVTTILESTD